MIQTHIAERIKQLRDLMQQHSIDYYFVPSSDAHHNEYVPELWQRRAWISGFTGSAGDVLVSAEKAFLWTDPRYFLQAEMELNPEVFTLMRQGIAPSIHDWLQGNTQNKKIAVDPKLMTIRMAQIWQSALEESQSELYALEANLIDLMRKTNDMPPTHPIKILDQRYTGVSAHEKIAQVRHALQQQHADAHVITALDAIAWLFNIRGSDVEYNPVVISYAVINTAHAIIFLDPKQITDELKQYAKQQQFELRPYGEFQQYLNQMHGSVLLDSNDASWWIEQQLINTAIIYGPSPITLLKACKNQTELAGMQEAHRRDAVAMCKFFHWLEQHFQNQTEYSAAKKLDAFRKEDTLNRGLSFETISGFAEHGAIIHYRVTQETDIAINNQHLYLVDSGGQYLSGTTDITRTIHLGTPKTEEKRHYTLVLKGHLALRHTIFPEGTRGEHLDAIARKPLWHDGLDYGHGTGHGVGCYLCVHEGPQRISQIPSGIALKPGMIVSNEPGVYFPKQYGIRIENLCFIKQEFDSFFTFADLTLVPYARNLIDKSLLSAEEISWINEYHHQIECELMELLSSEVKIWLKNATRPL